MGLFLPTMPSVGVDISIPDVPPGNRLSNAGGRYPGKSYGRAHAGIAFEEDFLLL